ncbi:MAG: amidohydrolase [Patescibacteria group bacterium]
MKTLIEHGLVLCGPELEPYPGAAVAVENGVILHVGTIPPGWTPNERIDAGGRIVIPGLVNAHTHAAMTLLRGYADDLPLQEWLSEKIWPAEAGLTGEHVYWGTLLAALEMLRTGTTTFADMYFRTDDVARAVEESGMRAALSYGMIGLDPAKAERELAMGLDCALRLRGAAGGRLTAMLAPHAPYTCPDGFLREAIAAAAGHDLAIHIHVSETERENREMLSRTGRTPTAHLAELGLFTRPVLLAHGVWLTAEDIGILARAKAGVAHCPGSNLKLASGIAPVAGLLRAGVPVGLGTDGAASNNNLDLWREIHLAALVHKVREGDATAVPAQAALRMATSGGAACLGLSAAIGAIAPGYRADLIMVDLDRLHLTPLHNAVSHLVYAAEGFDVTDVMVDGRFLLRRGEFIHLDAERVRREAGRLGLDLAARARRS